VDVAVTASVSEQLRERAHRLRVTAERLHSVEVLALVRTVAQDPHTWGGDVQRAFCGWLDAFCGWLRAGLAGAAEQTAAAIERHRRDVDDALLQANLGMGAAQPQGVRDRIRPAVTASVRYAAASAPEDGSNGRRTSSRAREGDQRR
jgi:hypothetical protein